MADIEYDVEDFISRIEGKLKDAYDKLVWEEKAKSSMLKKFKTVAGITSRLESDLKVVKDRLIEDKANTKFSRMKAFVVTSTTAQALPTIVLGPSPGPSQRISYTS